MKVVFGTATFEKSVCIEYLDSMVRTVPELMARGWEVKLCIISGNCFVDSARNDIVRSFLADGADSLFFIDSDQGWDPLAVVRLLEHPAELVGGVVPKRCDGPEFNIGGLNGHVESDWLEVSEVGTGFMRIRRSVFTKMDAAYPEYSDLVTMSGATAYFRHGFHDGAFLGEDVFFCRQWRKLGGTIWIYPDISFSHRGSKVWTGNFHTFALDKQIYTVKGD